MNEHDRCDHKTGEMVSKSNFLGIYGQAHLHTLTLETINWPFKRLGSGHLTEISF